MFEDVCFACSRPVDPGRAYCSHECALQDAPAADAAAHFQPYPSLMKNSMNLSTDRQLPPFVLHNPHPDYQLPLALASPFQGPKRPSSTLQHARKRSSLSSSSASSTLSTPSAPPLTDDDDSMSDPEFMLDPRAEPSSSNPMLMYARRPSATNTRSTIAPVLSSSSSTSTSASAPGVSRTHIAGPASDVQQRERTPSRVRRPRHAHHLSVPTTSLLDGFDKLFYADEHDRRRHVEQVRPHSFKHPRHLDYDNEEVSRTEELEASYATLTKLSVTTKGAETISHPKSRRTPTRMRPRASLPAYLSLMKLASPSANAGGFPGASPPREASPTTAQMSNRASHYAHKTSPTVAQSHTSSSTATISGSFSPASVRTAATAATMNQPLRGESPPSTASSPPHLGDRTGSPHEGSVGGQGSSFRSKTIPIASSGPGIVTLSKHEVYGPEIRPFHVLDTLCECDGACSGTPRGRTRSRSNRPRSRSRSRTRERQRRAHFGGAGMPPAVQEEAEAETARAARGPAVHLASGLGMVAAMSRGRPHVRGMGGRGRRVRRAETDEEEESTRVPRKDEVESHRLNMRGVEALEAGRTRERRRV